MRALLVHHDANSLPGLVGEVLDERGFDSVTHRVCDMAGSPIGSEQFPDPASAGLIVVFGSRWSVYEEAVAHWVEPEMAFLRRADDLGIPVLGLCFGAQILAAAHGAKVAAADSPEVGWFKVRPHGTEIEPGPWLQWHFDTFEVPRGAEELAVSDAGPQAFRLRRNLGVQFHPEADRDVVSAWFDDDVDQIGALGIDPAELLAEADRQRPAARSRADRLLGDFIG